MYVRGVPFEEIAGVPPAAAKPYEHRLPGHSRSGRAGLASDKGAADKIRAPYAGIGRRLALSVATELPHLLALEDSSNF